ncbi:MAG TPA: FAD:protein FMN transferase [Candidatus Saccharimonadales bacterium]|jgi:thiamine biosynthesis lipoprotein
MLRHIQTRVALGSPVTLTVVSGSRQPVIDELFRQLWLLIFEFEKRFSRFLPASELSQFNREAAGRQPISAEFRSLLLAAKQMSALTNGLYNPFVLPALQRAGYTHSMVAAHAHDQVDDYSNRSVVSPDRLEVGDNWAGIPYGTAIDLGGCGKGYAGDLLADLIDARSDIQGYWFSLGGDIIARGLDEHGDPWVIQVEDTAGTGGIAGQCVTSGRERYAVATSSILRRKGVKDGRAWHHIIDPRTSRPADTDTATASVCAGTALVADVLASCAVILGSEQAVDFVISRGATGVLLQPKQPGAITYNGSLAPPAT